MKKFKVIGAYGEINFGDDLLMIVFEKFLLTEFPDSRVSFEGRSADYTRLLLENSTYNDSNFDCNYIIYGGGTQFFSFSGSERADFFKKLKIVLSEPNIFFNKLKSFLKKKEIYKVKTSFLGFGLGPFGEDELAINNAKKSIGSAEFVGVRDVVSGNYCKEWGVDFFLGADVVFSSYFDMISQVRESKTEGKKVGIIVRDWDFENEGNQYHTKIKDFFKTYSEFSFRFIIFSPLKDKKWMKFLEGEDVLVWDPKKFSIKDFLGELNKFDLLISARYHGAIIGLLLGKRVICIEIEPKLKILTEQVSELKLWESPFELLNLKKLIDSSIGNAVDYSLSIDKRRNLADNMLLAFKSKIK